MSISHPINHLGLIWYHSEPSDVPYSPNKFLALDFFCRFLHQDGSKILSLQVPKRNVCSLNFVVNTVVLQYCVYYEI